MEARDLVHIVSLVIALAAAITALTPTPRDNAILKTVRSVLDALAGNWGHAENQKKLRRRETPPT